MKKVCGTCNFQINAIAGLNGIEVICAHDSKQYKDNTPGCDKWVKYISNLSPQDKLSIVASERQTSLALESNRLAAEANLFARDANKVSREQASLAAISARWAKIAAIIAAIAAIISIVTTIIIAFVDKK